MKDGDIREDESSINSGLRRTMTVAGSDSGGGAGVQADLKTFMAFGVYGTSAITAVTAQNTVGVTSIHMIPPEMVAAQIDAILTDIGTDAVKIGMLGTPEVVSVVAERLRHYGVRNLVVDPVMVSSSGHRLLSKDGQRALMQELLPLALVVTPNLQEAEVLAGRSIESAGDLQYAARKILDLGPRWVLMKGGHRAFDPSGNEAVDILTDGRATIEFRAKRINTQNTHGTGCTLSAAIAAGLSRGLAVVDTVRLAKEYLTGALRTAHPLGRGHGPVNHRYQVEAK
ncbi:MAG: bifunctional hydroxymethylpyrimidine kinase/phosphomethylpyrimidine kinase [Bacillota bacterium]